MKLSAIKDFAEAAINFFGYICRHLYIEKFDTKIKLDAKKVPSIPGMGNPSHIAISKGQITLIYDEALPGKEKQIYSLEGGNKTHELTISPTSNFGKRNDMKSLLEILQQCKVPTPRAFRRINDLFEAEKQMKSLGLDKPNLR